MASRLQPDGSSRKWKETYLVRKVQFCSCKTFATMSLLVLIADACMQEEKLALESEIHELERQAAHLRVQVLRGPIVPECDPTADQRALGLASREHQRVVAKLQSSMSDCLVRSRSIDTATTSS